MKGTKEQKNKGIHEFLLLTFPPFLCSSIPLFFLPSNANFFTKLIWLKIDFSATILGFMRIPFLAFGALVLALLAEPVHAFQITIHSSVCAYIPCYSGGGSAGIVALLMANFIPSMYVLFGGVAGIYMMLNTIKMVTEGSDEGVVSEAKSNIIHIIVGCVVVGGAALIVESFGIGHGIRIVNQAPVSALLTLVIMFFRLVMGAALMANIVIQAFRLISSQGDSGQEEKARKRLITGFIGVGLMLLASIIVSAAIPGANSTPLAGEIVGIANFLTTLIGALCVVAIIVAGICYVISIDEGFKDKAKTAIKVSIVTLVVTLLAYAVVNTLFGI